MSNTATNDIFGLNIPVFLSDKSWEEGGSQAITWTSKSVHGIQSIDIKDMEAKVENNKYHEISDSRQNLFFAGLDRAELQQCSGITPSPLTVFHLPHPWR
ncbi:MAG: dodecin domain-containing protein [Nitrospirales bacterium]